MCIRRFILIAAALGAISCAAAWGEDIPAFEKAFGWPAIVPLRDQTGRYRPPALVVDASRIYIGGRHVEVFDRASGDWQAFWPFASKARGLGEALIPGAEDDSPARPLAVSPWGYVYAADADHGAVHIYDPNGAFLGGWDGLGDSTHTILDLCAGDSSVYVLMSAGDVAVGGNVIARFASDGSPLNAWPTPSVSAPGYYCAPISLAPAAGGGVWLLTRTWSSVGDVVSVSEIRLHHYAPGGAEIASWPIDGKTDYAVAADQGGTLWVLALVPGPGDAMAARIRRFGTDGSLLGELPLAAVPDAFAVTPDAQVALLVPQPFSWHSGDPVEGAPYRLDFRDATGALIRSLGDPEDMQKRGALYTPGPFAVTASGESYAKTWFGDYQGGSAVPLPQFISHYDVDGSLLGVTVTGASPFPNPVTGEVEFRATYDTAGYDGNSYWLQVEQPPVGGSTVVDLLKFTSGALAATYKITVPYTILWQPALAASPDSTLRLVVDVGDGAAWAPSDVWVGTISTEGELLDSWTVSNPAAAWVECAAVDGGLNVYIGAGGVWKYAPDGALIGRIDGWGGSGDQRDAPASLAISATEVQIDPVGRVWIFDAATGHILKLAYTPAPFLDVPYYYWAKDAIRAALNADVVAGYSDGTYRPQLEVARDQMAVFIARALAGGDSLVPKGPERPTFNDVPQSNWAFDYVEYCARIGIVKGYTERVYSPEIPVDRAQMAVFIARSIAQPTGEAGLVNYTPPAAPSFPDVTADHWAYKYVEYVKEKGVVAGYPDGNYRPNVIVTRDQMAVYVARAFELPL